MFCFIWVISLFDTCVSCYIQYIQDGCLNTSISTQYSVHGNSWQMADPQITKFMGPTWGPPGSCRPQMGLMLAPITLLSVSICLSGKHTTLFRQNHYSRPPMGVQLFSMQPSMAIVNWWGDFLITIKSNIKEDKYYYIYTHSHTNQ